MLVVLSVMEQRYQAVLSVVQDRWRIVEVAGTWGNPAKRPHLDRSPRAR